MKSRILQNQLEDELFKKEVVILYGTRRVGKTTLVKQTIENQTKKGKKCVYFNCELMRIRNRIETTDDQALYDFFGGYDLVVLDEAQSIRTIGLTLKIMNDTFPDIQIIATGSSSFDIANRTGEPLVGRSRTFVLHQFSLQEIYNDTNDLIKLDANLENFMRFGLYPGVIEKVEREAIKAVKNIANSYLYKDILKIDGIKNSSILLSLLKLLALQIGNEVSYSEIANRLGISIPTVVKYIDLLEKCFVLFVLPAFSRNIRNEVGLKSRKIYFYDLGIRNAIINNFSDFSSRSDIGALWENFCIVELIKKAQYNEIFFNNYFWRNYNQQEIDYIEEYNGDIHAYEFKYNPKAKANIPKAFTETYGANIQLINRENFYKKLLDI